MAGLTIRPEDVPPRRPAGLRLRTIAVETWRIDARPPDGWEWQPFPRPTHRFDPDGGRVRYAAGTERGAFREHFQEHRRRIRPDGRSLNVLRLTGRIAVLDLREEAVLDRLGLDDEVSVGRSARALGTAQLLMTRALGWWGERLHGVAYRSRTTPVTSWNLAFTASAPLTVTRVGTVASRRALLARLIADDGFRLLGWNL